MHKTTVVLKIVDGQTKGVDQYGNFTRKFGIGNATDAIIQSDMAIVTYSSGKIFAYNLETGNYIRMLKH